MKHSTSLRLLTSWTTNFYRFATLVEIHPTRFSGEWIVPGSNEMRFLDWSSPEAPVSLSPSQNPSAIEDQKIAEARCSASLAEDFAC